MQAPPVYVKKRLANTPLAKQKNLGRVAGERVADVPGLERRRAALLGRQRRARRVVQRPRAALQVVEHLKEAALGEALRRLHLVVVKVLEGAGRAREAVAQLDDLFLPARRLQWWVGRVSVWGPGRPAGGGTLPPSHSPPCTKSPVLSLISLYIAHVAERGGDAGADRAQRVVRRAPHGLIVADAHHLFFCVRCVQICKL